MLSQTSLHMTRTYSYAVTPAASVQPTEPSDRELMLRLLRQDVAALELLYDRHHHVALGLACRILHDRSSAEEVVQEAFLTIWRQPERYDPTKGTARGWLLAIVHHRSVDRVRRATLRGYAGKLSPNLIDDRSGDPSDLAFWSMTREHLRQALDALPLEQRQTIELSYIHGRTHSEIAELMNCPLGTVKGRIRIGLTKLRATIPATAVLAAT